jgi:hypothetical protein
VCVPGITRIQPFDGALGDSATHAVTTVGGFSFHYVPS